MKQSFLKSDRLSLRAIEPEDLDVLYTIENDPRTWDMTNFTVPYSKFALQQYIKGSQCDMFADQQLRLMIVREADRAVIGTVDITDFVPRHARGEVGIAIRTEYQGNGYAKEALESLCEYAFGFLFLKQLTAHVAVNNKKSLQVFQTCGFEQCGMLKEWWFLKGRFADVVLLQRLRR